MNKINFLIIIFDLIITILAYELAPIIAKYILKKRYTEKEAKRFTIINCTIIFILFSLYHIIILQENKVANAAPVILWGTVCYYILKPKKEQKNINNEGAEVVDQKSEGINTSEWQSYLDKNYKTTGTTTNLKDIQLSTDKGMAKEEEKIKHKTITTNHSSIVYKVSTIILAIITLIVTTILIIYINNTKELNKKIADLEKTNNAKTKTISEYMKKYINESSKANFFDSYAVIIPVNTKVYHKYDCTYCDKSSFIIVNTEIAKSSGYKPCSHCMK